MTVSSSIVRVSEVTKNFQLGKIEVQALKGVDLEIDSGKYISIMGPSGSGKSTLFNMIGGLDLRDNQHRLPVPWTRACPPI